MDKDHPLPPPSTYSSPAMKCADSSSSSPIHSLTSFPSPANRPPPTDTSEEEECGWFPLFLSFRSSSSSTGEGMMQLASHEEKGREARGEEGERTEVVRWKRGSEMLAM